MSRKFVAINDTDGSGIYCLGIFDNYYTALGKIMDAVWEFGRSYKNDGDIYQYDQMDEMEGECGEVMQVTYKASCWDHECKEYYCILYADEEEGESE